MKKTKHGFSLVEMLVVIAIIAILAAVLFPAVSSALKKGKMTFALNSLKQVSQRTVTYAGEHRDFLPLPKIATTPTPAWTDLASSTADDAWFNGLLDYMDVQPASEFADAPESFYKPSNILYLTGARYPSDKLSRPYWAFGMNKNLSVNSGAAPIKIHTVSKPSVTVFMLEMGFSNEKPSFKNPIYAGRTLGGPGSFIARYDGRGVMAFLDSHGESRKISETVKTDGSAITPQKEIVWTADPADTVLR